MASKRIKLPPVHPGEILREDFLEPLELSINALARGLHVPANHVSGIVNEKRGISAVMALRMARYFGTSPERPRVSREKYCRERVSVAES